MQTCSNPCMLDGERYGSDLRAQDLILDDICRNAAEHAFIQRFVEVDRR